MQKMGYGPVFWVILKQTFVGPNPHVFLAVFKNAIILFAVWQMRTRGYNWKRSDSSGFRVKDVDTAIARYPYSPQIVATNTPYHVVSDRIPATVRRKVNKGISFSVV